MNDDIKSLKQELIDSITQYMKYGGAENEDDPDYDPDFDAGYSQAQIDRCSHILETFFSELEQLSVSNKSVSNKNEAIMHTVKTAVLNLNEVNDLCDGSMIETEQREQLYAIITRAAEAAGLVTDEDDITEEWREW